MADSKAPLQLTKDRIVIVTGANGGLGYAIAKRIAMMGATVIAACRSEQRATKAIEKMHMEYEAEKAKGIKGLTDKMDVEFMKLDLASFQSVLDFVENFRKSGRQLHVLFCNAGMGLQPYAKTADGHEMVLQVNYLGHFVLVAKLLPIMKQSGPGCRILLMTSMSHRFCGFNANAIEYQGSPEDFPSFEYYARSKLYQIMQMFCMVRRLAKTNVTFNVVSPGLVKTDLGENVPLSGFKAHVVWWFIRIVGDSPDKGARCSVDCVVNPKLEGVTGIYFENFKRLTPDIIARNERNQEALWTKTLEIVGQFITDEEKAGLEGNTNGIV